MIYADLHCDTATVLYDRQTDFNGKIHLNHRALRGYERIVQCFAVFTDDTKKNGGMKYFDDVVSYFMPLVRGEKNLLPVLTVEGGDVIEGNLDNLERLRAAGVRIFGLVWNGENELACGALTNNVKGLTELGLECVRRLEKYGIYPDVSHLSDAGFMDVAKQTRGRILATHSNARGVYSNLRNLTDEEIDIIVMRDGLIGLNLYPPFVGDNADIRGILHHTEYFLRHGAENALCLGCDMDGIDAMPRGFSDVGDVKKLIRALKRAYGRELAEKIAYKNALRVLEVS